MALHGTWPSTVGPGSGRVERPALRWLPIAVQPWGGDQARPGGDYPPASPATRFCTSPPSTSACKAARRDAVLAGDEGRHARVPYSRESFQFPRRGILGTCVFLSPRRAASTDRPTSARCPEDAGGMSRASASMTERACGGLAAGLVSPTCPALGQAAVVRPGALAVRQPSRPSAAFHLRVRGLEVQVAPRKRSASTTSAGCRVRGMHPLDFTSCSA